MLYLGPRGNFSILHEVSMKCHFLGPSLVATRWHCFLQGKKNNLAPAIPLVNVFMGKMTLVGNNRHISKKRKLEFA